MITYTGNNPGLTIYSQYFEIDINTILNTGYTLVTGSTINNFTAQGIPIFPLQFIVYNQLDNTLDDIQLLSSSFDVLTPKATTFASWYTLSPIQDVPKGHAHSNFLYSFYVSWGLTAATAGLLKTWLLFHIPTQ